MSGDYKEAVSIKKAKQKCNFGVGAGIGLGEAVALDNNYYLADGTGKASRLGDDSGLSFLTCTKFKPIKTLVVKNISLKQLKNRILKIYQHAPYMAISIVGSFKNLKARSEDIEKPPYTNLIDWLSHHQHKFQYNHVTGSLVMMYLSPSIIGVGVPGFHAHFISSNFMIAAHVLNTKIISAKVYIQPLNKLFVIVNKKPLNPHELTILETISK